MNAIPKSEFVLTSFLVFMDRRYFSSNSAISQQYAQKYCGPTDCLYDANYKCLDAFRNY